MENTLDKIFNDLEAKREELQKKVEELISSQDELQRVNAAILALGVKKQNGSVKIVADSYNADGTWKEKIKFVVALKKEASSKEIVDYICAKEPTLNEASVYNAITQTAIKLVEEEILSSVRDGKKNIYSLKK